MKRLLILAALLCSFAATRAQDIFDPSQPVTWLGLDFSSLRFIKSDETITDHELQEKYFPGWNELILNEPKKYDLAKAINHDVVENDIDAVTAANARSRNGFVSKVSTEFEHLEEADIRQMVKKYDLKGKSGIGLVFIVESMSKAREEASIWVTFINMGTREVLLTKPVAGKSGGFGFRNYWAGSVAKVLKALPDYMKKWKKGK